MPLFSPWRWWQARRKQKRLNGAFWDALREPAPHLEKLRALVQAGADVNGGRYNRAGTSAALCLALRGQWCTTATVRFLIQNGADIHGVPDSDGWTPILCSAQSRNEEKLRLLVEAGADVNSWDKWAGWTVLWWLIDWASIALLTYVLELGADPNKGGVEWNGWKPLHLAAHEGRAEAVALYLRYGADPMSHDKEGRTPRMLAETREPITDWTERWAYVPDLQEYVRLLRAAEQENKG